jgi:hypothetical protein
VINALKLNQVRNGGMHEQVILAQQGSGLCAKATGG